MTTESNKLVIRRWYDAMNQKDVIVLEKLAEEIFTSDCVNHDVGGTDSGIGPKLVKEFVRRSINSTFSHITTDEMLAEGNNVAVRGTVFFKAPAAADLAPHKFLIIFRFAGNLIAEMWQLSVAGNW
jgi:hypothetical protein